MIIGVTIGAMFAVAAGYWAIFFAYRRKVVVRESFDKLRARKSWPPLTLVVTPGLIREEERILSLVKSAASWWESELGVRFFVSPEDMGAGGSVIPIREAPADALYDMNHAPVYAEALVDRQGHLSNAVIYLQPDWEYKDDEDLEFSLRHEMGHCLGLGHDDYEESIMHRIAARRKAYVSSHSKTLLAETFSDS